MKPTAVIWWITLLGAVVGFLPNLISWLVRTLNSARRIEQYSEEILASGAGIAGNTAGVSALKDTLLVAPGLVERAESIERHAGTIESILAGSGRGGTPQERVEGQK